MHATETTPEAIAASIRSNVDDYWEDRKPHKEFSAEQSRLWSIAEKSGLVEKVSALVGKPRARQINPSL